MFQYRIPWRSHAGAIGLRIGLTFPAQIIMAARVEMPVAADGTGAGLQGNINLTSDGVTGTSAPAVAADLYCVIVGVAALPLPETAPFYIVSGLDQQAPVAPVDDILPRPPRYSSDLATRAPPAALI